MKPKSKIQTIITWSYAIVAILFAALFIYIGVFENADVFQARETGSHHTVENISYSEVTDSSAPIGVKKEYVWTMEQIGANESCLAFYITHHYAEVYFDGELVYSLMPKESNNIGKTVSSNWVMIPLYPEDSGKEIKAVVTPVYESVRERKTEFLVGSQLSIYLHRLKLDLPLIILSFVCIAIGLLLIGVQLFFRLRRRVKSIDLIYLGLFSVMLGLWKITDTRFSPLLFSANPVVLGYIAIGMLFIGTVPLLLFIKSQLPDFRNRFIDIVALICVVTALAAFVCQVTGIADLREIITLSHLAIALSMCSVVLTVALNSSRKKSSQSKFLLRSSLIVFFSGALADILIFYIKGNSSGIFFSIVAFVLYTIAVGIGSIREINKKAYTDTHTGLFNKSRCNEIIKDSEPISEPIGMIMLDLNRLKYTNDTMGHEAGDKMIFNFANILRSNIPSSNFIGRWGGDEFIIMVTNADKDKMQQYLSAIASAVERYNNSGHKPLIYYAAGYALSTDFPDYTRSELLKEADDQMYLNKKDWYAENSGVTGIKY